MEDCSLSCAKRSPTLGPWPKPRPNGLAPDLYTVLASMADVLSLFLSLSSCLLPSLLSTQCCTWPMPHIYLSLSHIFFGFLQFSRFQVSNWCFSDLARMCGCSFLVFLTLFFGANCRSPDLDWFFLPFPNCQGLHLSAYRKAQRWRINSDAHKGP